MNKDDEYPYGIGSPFCPYSKQPKSTSDFKPTQAAGRGKRSTSLSTNPTQQSRQQPRRRGSGKASRTPLPEKPSAHPTETGMQSKRPLSSSQILPQQAAGNQRGKARTLRDGNARTKDIQRPSLQSQSSLVTAYLCAMNANSNHAQIAQVLKHPQQARTDRPGPQTSTMNMYPSVEKNIEQWSSLAQTLHLTFSSFQVAKDQDFKGGVRDEDFQQQWSTDLANSAKPLNATRKELQTILDSLKTDREAVRFLYHQFNELVRPEFDKLNISKEKPMNWLRNLRNQKRQDSHSAIRGEFGRELNRIGQHTTGLETTLKSWQSVHASTASGKSHPAV